MASDQFYSPALAASAFVQRLMWRRIESSMNNRQVEETLSSETLRVACGVGPGCSLSMLWLPNLPDAPLQVSMTVHFVSLSLPTYSVSTGCPMNSTLPVPLPRPLPLFPLTVPLRRVLHPAYPTFMAGMTCCCTSSSNSSSSLHVSSASQSLDKSLAALGGS